jgi:hypothetical protein
MKCYRWTSSMLAVDPDTVSLYVQRAGGHFATRADTVMFWVPERSEMMMILTWPDLERISDQDLI